MYYVKNERHGEEIYDPAWNLAAEYYLLEQLKLDEPILFFYINQPSIIVGKNQNTRAEVNREYCEEKGIKIVRRKSGGGAVYHDYGNISFCFLTDDDGNSFRRFQKFTAPVIEALHKMGVDGAELQGRNDLMIDGKKFSGNAMYAKDGRMTAHGTLMFDVDLDVTTKALRPKKEKLQSKGIKSIRKRVTNIKPYLPKENQDMTIHEFRTTLIKNIFNVDDVEDAKQYILTDEDWEGIKYYHDTFTGNDDWNFGKNPDYQLVKEARTPAGQVEFHFDISNEKISDLKIYGDFFGLGEISDVEKALIGIPYTEDALMKAFEGIDINHYFGATTAEELVHIIK
ncbi:MAG: lipoate--protein ligase [Aerococcus sp.]|nr:lipoate--protein ligase [Aerococcus sp.]